jgi:hypothetical protein
MTGSGLFPSVSETVERINGTGHRTGTATLYAYRGPGGVVLKLGMLRAVIELAQWRRIVAALAQRPGSAPGPARTLLCATCENDTFYLAETGPVLVATCVGCGLALPVATQGGGS